MRPGATSSPDVVDHLVDHGEAIALAQVGVEIDVRREYARDLHRHRIRDARRIGRGEERRADRRDLVEDARGARRGRGRVPRSPRASA